MSTPLLDQVEAALGTVNDPEIKRPITELGMVESVDVDPAGVVRLTVLLTVAGCPMKDTINRDVDAAVRTIVDHYERRGDAVIVMLAQEPHEELLRRVTADGRRLHRAWVEEVFAPYVDRAADPDELVDLLVVATDVYTWKLLRRDRGLARDLTENRIHTLVRTLLGADGPAHH